MKPIITKRGLIGAACALSVALAGASPALALDPEPKTYREKQKHQFRDASLGLTHPVEHGRSTQTNPAPADFFSWLSSLFGPQSSASGTGAPK